MSAFSDGKMIKLKEMQSPVIRKKFFRACVAAAFHIKSFLTIKLQV